MYHLQVDSMEARLFLLYVTCQMIITSSLGGVTLPFPDLVGKVTPLKPKPLSPSIVSSSSTSICQDIMPKSFPLSLGRSTFREFSSPLAFTSTSRALPVPKIDSSSIADVKMPERLREKFLSRLHKASVIKINPDFGLPEISSYKNPFVSFPSKLPNVDPVYSSSDLYPTSLNKLASLPSIKSLPIVPVEALESYNVAPSTCNLPLTLKSRPPAFFEQSSNYLFPSSSLCSLPYPLYYKSVYLPGVKTPSDTLSTNYKPILNTENINMNIPSQSYAQNLLNSERNILSTLPYSTSSGLSNSQNMIQIPKPSLNVPFLIKPVISSPLNLEPISCTSVPFKGSYEPRESLISDLRNDKEVKSLISSLSRTLIDKISDFRQKSFNPPKISTAARVLTPPKDCSEFNIPIVYPVIDSQVKTTKRVDSSICTPCVTFDSKINVPEIVNRPLMSAISPNQYPLISDKCVLNTLKYSPPTIPRNPIPNISSGTCNLSPLTYCPSKTSVNPCISYVSQHSSSSIDQSTSKMVSAINEIASNIAQNILSKTKCETYTNTAPQRPYTFQSNHYDAVIKSETPSVVTFPQFNAVNAQSILNIKSSPIDCVNLPAIDTTFLSLDAPCIPSTFELCPSQSLPISSQPLAATVLPVSSFTFSLPQLCPSYLPSPILPSYPSVASPLYMEAPVYKVSSSKKESEVEKLMELMLIAEILNNDESFDWDDLDMLLAFLSIS